MSSSGSSPMAVVRDGMWGFLLFAAAVWLAIAWSVPRLEPAGVVQVAGSVILFGAWTEAVRALARTRTWWLNAGMAVLFAATGVILLTNGDSLWTTPAALIGGYLMVRGAADVAISMLSRESDRIWGLLMVVGVAELGLGFFAASSFARQAHLVIVVLGGAALARGVTDLVASLRLREASTASRRAQLRESVPELALGVAGYSAGLADFGSEALPRASGAPAHEQGEPWAQPAHEQGEPWAQPAHEQGEPSGSFHDQLLRTTADLDAMLALAGMTGAAVPGALAQAAVAEQVEVPDATEGAESPAAEEAAAAAATSAREHAVPDDRALPLLDPAARAGQTASPGMDDTSIMVRSRLLD